MNKSLILLFFIVPLFQSCYEIGGKDYLSSSSSAGVSSDPGSGSATLASQVIEELKSSLSSLLSFRSSRDSNSRSSSFKLNSDDIDHLLAGAEKAIIESNLTDSEDLNLVLQKVAEGEAEATRQVFQAIHDGDPTSDVLAVRYLEALAQIADGRATKIVVPTEFSGVLGAVTGIAEAMRQPAATDETEAQIADMESGSPE